VSQMMSWKLGIAALGVVCCLAGTRTFVRAEDSGYRLTATLASGGTSKELKSWSLADLGKYKKTTGREKDPVTSKLMRWEGVLLSHLIEKSLAGLPNESQAQVDLVVLKSTTGQKALIPRALVNKYPVLLAILPSSESSPSDVQSRGPIYSVVPWSSKPQILREDLPLAHFFVPKVASIELTNYREQYQDLFLKRRTDPAAMRGEKLFVRNCVSCHAAGGSRISGIPDPAREELFATQGHPETPLALKLSERDRKSIARYLVLHREENSAPAAGGGAGGKTMGMQFFLGR